MLSYFVLLFVNFSFSANWEVCQIWKLILTSNAVICLISFINIMNMFSFFFFFFDICQFKMIIIPASLLFPLLYLLFPFLLFHSVNATPRPNTMLATQTHTTGIINVVSLSLVVCDAKHMNINIYIYNFMILFITKWTYF